MRALISSLVVFTAATAAVHCGSSTGGSNDTGPDSGTSGESDSSLPQDAARGGETGAIEGGSSLRDSGSGDAGNASSGHGSGEGGGPGRDGGGDAPGSGTGASDAANADVHSGSHDGSVVGPEATASDGGWAFGCSATIQTGPTVPASGYLFFAQGTKSYALASDNVSWTVVDRHAATATTEPIPLPAGVNAFTVQEVGGAYDAAELLLFGDPSAPFATFWDGSSFSAPVALPTNTLTIRADGARHLFAVDSANVLWDGRSGTFVNRGGVPFQNGVIDIGPPNYGNWDWTVSPTGIVSVVYATETPPGVGSQRYDATLSWSNLAIVSTTYASTDSYSDIQVSGGSDESVHATFVDTYDVGTGGDTGTVAGYARTHGTDAWDVHSLPYSATALDVEASSYDNVQALFAAEAADLNGDFSLVLEWAVPTCNGSTTDWWSTTTIEADAPVQAGAPRMGVGAGGYPSFYVAVDSGTAVLTTY